MVAAAAPPAPADAGIGVTAVEAMIAATAQGISFTLLSSNRSRCSIFPLHMSPLNILIDDRERASNIPRLLASMPDTRVTFQRLDIGDYMDEGGKLYLERKSAADFTASIISKRLFTQVEMARTRQARIAVVVEGDPFAVGRSHDAAIAGALSYLPVIEGVSVVTVNRSDQAAQLIHTMLRHAVFGLGYEVSLQPPKPKTLEAQRKHVICSLPGVGEKTAAALLLHFGSVGAVMRADQTALEAVPGVGKKLAQQIASVLG